MTEHSIKDIVSIVKDNGVFFTHFYGGDLWYKVDYKINVSDDKPNGEWKTLAFPVPTSDAGNATFYAEDKAMLFMRYIRKQINNPVANIKG